MALLEILKYPDERLRKLAQPVTAVDSEITTLISEMLETMYAAPGIGLAATQVNVHKRVIVVDVSENQDEPLALVNPEIVAADGVEVCNEGCLSVPEIFAKVERAEHIRVKALDRTGKPIEFEADNMKAICIQHEIDHLDGKLFVDYLSPLKRQRIRKKMEKQQRHAAAL